jgi:PRTRC genetic system ThiF family protein
VILAGCGGTGSILATHLARIWQAWTRLGGNPFRVTLYDPDTVTEANLARQCFCAADIGHNKAQVLAQRLRDFFGIEAEALPHKLTWLPGDANEMMVVTCVDSLAARRQLAPKDHPTSPNHYWLDCGNEAHTGQVILGGHGLPTFFDVYPQARTAKEPKSTPSCSMAEALEKQDLFINSTLATLAGQLLWTLMRRGGLTHHGYFVNLTSGKVAPLAVQTQ